MVSMKVLTPNHNNDLNKQIVLNMESVLKSVKHHKKHRLRKIKRHEKSFAKSSPETKKQTGGISGFFVKKEAEKEAVNAFDLLMSSNGGRSKATSTEDNRPPNDENLNTKRRIDSVDTPPSTERKPPKKRKTKEHENGGLNVEINSKTKDNSPPTSTSRQKRQKKKLFDLEIETVASKSIASVTSELPEKTQETNAYIVVKAVEPDKLAAGRPRRSCTNNISYNETILIDVLPTLSNANTGNTATSKEVINEETLPTKSITKEIITIDIGSRSPTPKKLAPLFVKGIPRPAAVDPEIVKARHSFLMSDLPEKLRIEIVKKRLVVEENADRLLWFFPEVSHIQQIQYETQTTFDTDKYERLYNVASNNENEIDDLPIPFKLSRSTEFEKSTENCQLSILSNEAQKKSVVRQLKETNGSSFPTFHIYKMLMKKDLNDSCQSATDVFKPIKSDEFLFNRKAVAELKDYLENFMAEGNGLRDYDSEDEFSNSSDSCSGNRLPTMVLHGPCSTGKTSSVYALSNELKINVIEINASSKRNGAKILQQLQEATQSHKVNMAKLCLGRKALRKMEREDKKASLILIEDIDLVFGEDTGFLNAITQLMSLTKRPIILTTNNKAASILKGLFNDTSNNFKFLEYKRPANNEACVNYLQLLGVLGGCSLDKRFIENLMASQKFDLRGSILKLDFLTQTSEIQLANANVGQPLELQLGFEKYAHNNDDRTQSEQDMQTLKCFYDNLSIADCWEREAEDNTQQEIIQEIKNLSAMLVKTKLLDIGLEPVSNQDIKKPVSLSSSIDSEATKSVSVHLDLEPVLRTICRSEKERKTDQRSTSRFYHYLLRDKFKEGSSFSPKIGKRAISEKFDSSCELFLC